MFSTIIIVISIPDDQLNEDNTWKILGQNGRMIVLLENAKLLAKKSLIIVTDPDSCNYLMNLITSRKKKVKPV